MKNEITIDNKTFEMASNALTPILYRQIFKKDFLREITGFKSLKGKKADDYTEDDIDNFSRRSEAFSRIAFVMAKQAEISVAAELVKLTELDYLTWLSDFKNQAFTDAEVLTKILAIWQGNAEDMNIEAKN